MSDPKETSMHLPTVVIGAAAIVFGIYTLWARSA
jgi:hypothetical protein